MKLNAFLETKNTTKWEFLQTGIFPASTSRMQHSTLWHQPFDFDDDKLLPLLFGEHGLIAHRTFPTDVSTDIRLIRSLHTNVLDEGWLAASDLLCAYNEHTRTTLPGDSSLFWRDLNLLNKLGMPHRVRLIVWLTK